MLYVGTWYELIALPVMTRIEVSHFLHRRAPHRTVLDIRAPEKSPENERVPRREVSQREGTNSSHFFRRLCELLTGGYATQIGELLPLGVVIRRHFESRTSNSSLALRFSTRIAPHYFFGMQDEFLYAPVQQFCDEEHVFRRARYLMNPAKLLQLLAGLTQHPQYLPVQTQLVDTPGKRVCSIQHLIGARSDAQRP